MRVIKVNRDDVRRQRLLEARKRHLLFEAKKKKRMKEADYPTDPKKRGYGTAEEIGEKGYGNVGGMSDAKPNKKVIPALENKRRSLSERRNRINEMRQRRMQMEAKARRLHESAQEEEVQPTREERFLEWLERREQRKLMEARKALREAMEMEECNECGDEEPRKPMRRRVPEAKEPVEEPTTESKSQRLREARLRLIRKSLAEARARREAALRESAADAVKTLEPPKPENPVKGEDLQDKKDDIENAKKLEGPDAPHKEEKPGEVKDTAEPLVTLGDEKALPEAKKAEKAAKGLKESQAYLNRKARLQKYLKEHAQ